METIKILVKDISLFDGIEGANVLARYNLIFVNYATNQEYPEVFVDILENEKEADCPRISVPDTFNGPMNLESLKEILTASYKYHTEEGSVLDNFLFFDEAESATPVSFEIDESGIPVEVHYMSVA